MKNEEAKQRAKNYMSLKGALEPKQIKCYCGHTITCDCIPKEEPTAYHYLSCCRSIEECHCGKYPNQIKCYCGHTTMCDCSPIDEQKDVVLGYKTSLDAQMLDKIEHIDEAFGIIYVLETLLDFAGEDNATSISISTTDTEKIIKLLKQKNK